MLTPAVFLLSLLFGGDKVVINEFSYDDSGTDDREFVELYNPTAAAIDISGWKLKSTDPFGINSTHTVSANTTLAAGDYYVMGSAVVTNVDQVIGTTNIWENSQESLILLDADDNVIDSLVYEANKGLWAGSEEEGEGVLGNFTNIDGHETSWSRYRDGQDSNTNRDFRLQPATPGTSNNLAVGGYTDTFDAASVGDAVSAFGHSFADPRVIDPTTVDTNGYNPNVIAASPQGGKAAIFWDSSGGGNSCMLLRDPSCNVVVEAFVYFDATPEPAGQREVWSLGVQGTTGTFYNLPDPSGAAGFTANGNTGVSWTFENTDTNSTLYLVDHNDGGRGTGAKTDWTVVGKIDLTTATDGWHRLRLEVTGSTVTGYFGGTFGGTNGTKVTGTLAMPAEGGVYVGYREGVSVNSTARPFTCDQLTITPSAYTGAVDTTEGTATKTTVGTPRAGTNGSVIVGNASFAMTGLGLVPSGTSFWGIGTKRTTPLDLSLVGGQSGSLIYVDAVGVFAVSADSLGEAALKHPIPNSSVLIGTQAYLQILDFDPALTVPTKLGNSRLLRLKIG